MTFKVCLSFVIFVSEKSKFGCCITFYQLFMHSEEGSVYKKHAKLNSSFKWYRDFLCKISLILEKRYVRLDFHVKIEVTEYVENATIREVIWLGNYEIKSNYSECVTHSGEITKLSVILNFDIFCIVAHTYFAGKGLISQFCRKIRLRSNWKNELNKSTISV